MKTRKRFSWGTGILLVYLLFIAGIVVLVTGSFRQQIDLVTPDYYAQELVFQKQIDKVARSRKLAEPLKWKVETGAVELFFPSLFSPENISGTVLLFRPSDAKHDVSIPVKANNDGTMRIGTEKLHKGLYRMQIDWQANGQTYFNEEVIVVQ